MVFCYGVVMSEICDQQGVVHQFFLTRSFLSSDWQASLRPSRDHSGCSTLRRYYAQLQFLQSRFPMGDGGAVNVQFSWFVYIFCLFRSIQITLQNSLSRIAQQ